MVDRFFGEQIAQTKQNVAQKVVRSITAPLPLK
jgi:hypothetical protein